MRRSRQRLIMIGVVGLLLAAGVGLSLYGLRDSVAYFYKPSEIVAKARPGERVRLGGLVEAGSVQRGADGVLRFSVGDGIGAVAVLYHGQPPDLFAENQGVVAEGVWKGDAVFQAERVLAKHDETYMPREVAEALKKDGEWKGAP
jgi:cytochrome c-type biogenesis protein CcmE